MRIPETAAELSPEWLTAALRAGGKMSAVAIDEVHCEGIAGSGLYGQIFRLVIVYQQSSSRVPETLVAKLSSSRPEMRTRPNTIASYLREVRFYQTIAKRSGLAAPKCYYTDIDVDSGWHVILMEDLSHMEQVDLRKSCSEKQVYEAVSAIAQFHAQWWNKRQMKRLVWLHDATPEPDDGAIKMAFEQWIPVFADRVGPRIGSYAIEAGSFVARYRGNLIRHLFLSEPHTLVHGDFAVGNLMFGGARGERIRVIDWQFMKPGRGIWDVAYFLAVSVSRELRRRIERQILELYLGILRENGVRHYSLDDAYFDYRVSLLHRFGSVISTIAAMPLTEEQLQHQIDVTMSRVCDAVTSNDCMEVLDIIALQKKTAQ